MLKEETDKQQASDKIFNITFHTEDENGNVVAEAKEVQMCQLYFSDKTMSKVLGTSIGFIIIGVNVVLKIAIIKLITWIGEDTVSEQLASITNGVFYA